MWQPRMHWSHTQRLQEQCSRVQQEQGNVEEEENGFNRDQRWRPTLYTRQGDVYSSGTHSNRELTETSVFIVNRILEQYHAPPAKTIRESDVPETRPGVFHHLARKQTDAY